MGQPTEPTRTYLKRPQGILFLIWISILCAWFIHEGNWIPGICIGGALILGLIGGQRKQEGETWWQYSLYLTHKAEFAVSHYYHNLSSAIHVPPPSGLSFS